MHLVFGHLYPKDYDFYIVNDGIDHRVSMLRTERHRRQSSVTQTLAQAELRARGSANGGSLSPDKASSNNGSSQQTDLHRSMEQEKETENSNSGGDSNIDSLTGAMSALRFVPPSVQFGRGRGRGRGGFSRT